MPAAQTPFASGRKLAETRILASDQPVRMRTTTKLLAGAAGLAAVAAAAATYSTWRTDRVQYETVLSLDGAELRRYPGTVLVETTAPSSRVAFRRLFRYIAGENAGGREVEMTAPVRTEGVEISMTAPVRVGRGDTGPTTVPVAAAADGSVTMAFYLPAEYTPETAPEPTNPDVDLVVEPPRTLAVRRFSWRPTADRVADQERRLLETLDEHGIESAGDPFFLGYDAPGTLPFLRTNEVAVPVRED